MAVTREDLEQNRLRAAPGDSPVTSLLLTETALETSFASALAWLSTAHGDCQDAWVFGYGSFIQNSVILRTKTARIAVHGYHHGSYLYFHINRDTWDNLGLVLGLDRGGSYRGVVFHIPCDRVEHEFRMLRCRKMLAGTYLPRWLLTEISGRRALTLTFVMSCAHEAYASRLPDERVAGCLCETVGLYGPVREYLQCTLIGLTGNGLRDPYLGRLWSRLQTTDTADGLCATTDATDVAYIAPLPDLYLNA